MKKKTRGRGDTGTRRRDAQIDYPLFLRVPVSPRPRVFFPTQAPESVTMPPLRPILISEYRLRELSVPVASSV